MVTIRPALPSEYAAIGSLTADAYSAVLLFGDADPYRTTLMDAARRAEAADLWAAIDNDELVGTVTVCRPGTDYAEIAGPDEIEVRMLAVTPAAQGRRIGAHMMAQVHRVAALEGFGAVVLSVVASNVRAAAFYASLGYARVPKRDWLPVPDVALQVWRLPDPGRR